MSDWEGAVGLSLDASNVMYLGQSLGAIIGTVWVSVTPEIRRAVLNVPGSDMVDLFVESTYFGPQIQDYFDNGVMVETPSFEQERLLNVARWLIDAVDPHSIGHLYAEEDRDVMIQMSTGDIIIPNRTTRLLERISGRPLRTYPSPLHGDLIIPALGDAMLNDATDFLAGRISEWLDHDGTRVANAARMPLRLRHAVPLALALSLAPSGGRAQPQATSVDAGTRDCTHAEARYPSGLLPADVGALPIETTGLLTVDPALRVRLQRLEPDATRTSLAFDVISTSPTVLVRPVEPLEVGTTIVLTQSLCQPPAEPPRETVYRVVEAIDPPDTLGTIDVSPLYASNYDRGVQYRFYYVDVRLVPSDVARERAGFLDIRPQIDDDEHAWSPLTEERFSRIHVDCGTDPGRMVPVYAPGDHTFQYAARDPLGEIVARVSRVITLGCDDATRVDPRTARELEPWEREYWDTEGPLTSDGGVAPLDGSTGAPPVGPGAAGCACVVGGGAESARLPAVVFGIVLAATQLRRRKSSDRSTS